MSNCCFWDVQVDLFASEIGSLQAVQPLPRRSSITKLTPMLDDNGNLKVQGWVQESDCSYAARHPVIVRKGHLATILTQGHHVELKHTGFNSVLTDLWKSFSLIGGKRIVKGMKKSCVACQQQDSIPGSALSGPLPAIGCKQPYRLAAPEQTLQVLSSAQMLLVSSNIFYSSCVL